MSYNEPLPKPRPHGTYACYQYGPNGTNRKPDPCRCDACKGASRSYQRAYRRAGRDRWVNERMGTCVRSLGWPRADNDYSVKKGS